MSIHIRTNTPQSLLRKIRIAIEENDVRTWLIDKDGDFTHDTDQWRFEAWLRPRIGESELIFGIISRKDVKMSTTVYAIYHGRFAEMILTHFDRYVSDIRLSSIPTQYDSL